MEQNIVTNTPVVQDRPKDLKWFLSREFKIKRVLFGVIFGYIIVLLTLFLSGYFDRQALESQDNNVPVSYNVPTSNNEDPKPEEKEDNPKQPPVVDEVITVPEKKTVYLGTYEGKDAIFVTDDNKQVYYEQGGVEKRSEFVGELVMSDGTAKIPSNFSELIKPKKLFTQTDLDRVFSLKLNENKTVAYIAMILTKNIQDNPYNLSNMLIQINVNNLASSVLWVNDMLSKKYDNANGPAYVDSVVNDKYMIVGLGSCYACGGGVAGNLVLNIATRNEKYLSDVGSIQINIPSNNFTYQKLATFNEPCNSVGPDCSNGQKTVVRPDGQVFTETLP
jgi:hypothetical protein